MSIQELRNKFIDEEIWILTFGGAFQRAEIYKKDNLSDTEREKIARKKRQDAFR